MKDALSLCENDEQELREVGRKDALLLCEEHAGQDRRSDQKRLEMENIWNTTRKGVGAEQCLKSYLLFDLLMMLCLSHWRGWRKDSERLVMRRPLT